MPKNMRHIVNVMRPTEAHGESSPRVYDIFRSQVPCSIETLSGREAERMMQMYADARVKVEMYGDPNKQIKATDQCVDQFGKTLNVLAITDNSRTQLGKIELICGEEVA